MAEDATPRPTGRPRRRWLRRSLWALGILLLLVVLSPLALALGPVRGLIAARAGEALGRRVEIGSAGGFWGKGFDLEDVTIHSPPGFDGPLATVQKIHVDVDVLGLLGGGLEASVRIVAPHVTFRRNAAGHGNADGLFEGEEEAEPREASAGTADLELVVIGGRLEAPPSGEAPGAVVDKIQVTGRLTPTGVKSLVFEATALEARRGGGDAKIRLDASVDAGDTGSAALRVEPMDLTRLAPLVEAPTGFSDLAGFLSLTAETRVQAGRPAGRHAHPRSRAARRLHARGRPPGARATHRGRHGPPRGRTDDGRPDDDGHRRRGVAP